MTERGTAVPNGVPDEHVLPTSTSSGAVGSVLADESTPTPPSSHGPVVEVLLQERDSLLRQLVRCRIVCIRSYKHAIDCTCSFVKAFVSN